MKQPIDESSESAEVIANNIKMDFNSTKIVNVETVSQTVNLMDKLIDLQAEQLQNVSHDQKLNVVFRFQENLLAIASDLLQEDVLIVLENGQEGESAKAGTSISDEVEESAFLLADTFKYGTVEINSETIDMKVRAVDINDKSNDTEEDNEEHYVVSLGDKSSCSYLKLPRLTEKQTTTLLTMTDGPEDATEQSTVSVGSEFMATVETSSLGLTKEKLKIMFVAYKTLGKFLHSDHNDDINSMANDNATESYNGTVDSRVNTTKLVLDSHVIGASLRFGDHPFTEFEDNQTVEFCLTRLNLSLFGKPKCVYWNYSEITNTGKWLDNGCETKDMTTHIVCTCNHLTNFAILMDVHKAHAMIPEPHEDALGYITIIGCSISIVALLACIFVFSILKRLKSLRTTIHRNLCISLAASQFIFIVGVERTENKVVCSVIAGALHYSFLVSFMWMCLEGIHLYVTLVRVFNAGDHGVLQYYLAAYALPLLVVAVLAGSVPEGYGTDKYCWLSTENNFILAFAAPVAVIILLNLVILVVSLRKAYASSKAMKQEATKTQQLRTWVKGAITLLFLLGSTWATGLLFFSRSSVFVAYIFTILNSLQGFFIFLFYCFNNDTVKKETKRWLSMKRWVPIKIRELLKETPKTTSMGNTLSNLRLP
ncbi:adhesion G protein-coupled receptor L2-like isoform X2 [Anneissia japonica]|uniref:adhesion G protein-coupled receptor L2-like isoform X2 n=1 Tax=Anneissia japonica TaxID=1529436 RepID=UPI0014256A43|nr:adhesion G protein-coupled receptor L2-like isoform X2 [Anneissia japonica]